MKRNIFCGVSLLAFFFTAPFAAAEEDILVIEMDGKDFASAPAPSVSVWQKNAKQLTKLFKGKTRSYVLKESTSVPSLDEILRTPDGKEYILLRYGDEDSFRKFLFDAKDPQLFLAAADDVPGVLALRLKYNLPITVTQAAFQAQYPNASLMNISDLKEHTSHAVFTLNNKKANAPAYYVFEGEELTHIFTDDASYNAYLDKLSASNKQFSQEQEAQRQAQEAARQKALQEQEEQKRREAAKWQRALVEGGTTQQYLYGPRLIKGAALERRKKQQEEQKKK